MRFYYAGTSKENSADGKTARAYSRHIFARVGLCMIQDHFLAVSIMAAFSARMYFQEKISVKDP